MGKYLADSYDAALRENADLKTRLAEAEARHQRVMAVIRPFCAKYTPDLLAEFDAAAASSTDKICARAAHLSDVLVKDSAPAVGVKFYRLEHKLDRYRVTDFDARMWNLIVVPADQPSAVTCDHFPGQPVCEWCKGTGAVDAPTSADDPSCPDCDGEGTWAK